MVTKLNINVIEDNSIPSSKLNSQSFKTINGETIIGEGDLKIDNGNVYSLISMSSSATTQVLEPNTYYVWDEVSELDLSFNEGNVNQTNEYVFQFKSGENTTTLLLPDNIKWANNIPPNINANKLYQISVLNNLGSILEFDA